MSTESSTVGTGHLRITRQVREKLGLFFFSRETRNIPKFPLQWFSRDEILVSRDESRVSRDENLVSRDATLVSRETRRDW